MSHLKIEFTKTIPHFAAGVTATLPENVARNIIAQGVAKEYAEPNPPIPEDRKTVSQKMIKKSKGK
jgi:hypothetical protein